MGHGGHARIELRSKRAEQRQITHFTKRRAPLVNEASLLLFGRLGMDFFPQVDAALVINQLADELKIAAGDYVSLTSPQGNLTPFGMLPRARRFRVGGIFDSGFYDYDANWGFVTLASAQGLAGVGDVVSLLEVRVAKLDDAQAVANELVRRAGPRALQCFVGRRPSGVSDC